MALSHIGGMGINTLRVGPLLCPDNVGMLIFRDIFWNSLVFAFSFPFFNFLMVLHPKISTLFRASSFAPSQREVSGLCPINRSHLAYVSKYSKVLILPKL
jgi:hypothetical protein